MELPSQSLFSYLCAHLQQLMYAIECGDYRDIIDWSPSGLAFIIINPKKFENTVLPDIFKDAKFNSFDRKVCGTYECVGTRTKTCAHLATVGT